MRASPARERPEADSPLLSVVVVALNSARYIGACLESIPTEMSIETLVVDGGSTDDTVARIRAGFPTVRVVLAQGTTIPQARNRGLREATGVYVLFLDSDDVLIAEGARALVRRLRADRPAIGLSAVRLVDGTGRRLGERRPRHPHRVLDLFGNPWATSGVACRREDLIREGGFSVSFELAEDYDLWLRTFEGRQAALLDVVVAEHRVHEDSVSHRRGLRLVAFAMRASFAAAKRRRIGIGVRILLAAYWIAWHFQPDRWSSRVRGGSSFGASLLARIASRERA